MAVQLVALNQNFLYYLTLAINKNTWNSSSNEFTKTGRTISDKKINNWNSSLMSCRFYPLRIGAQTYYI